MQITEPHPRPTELETLRRAQPCGLNESRQVGEPLGQDANVAITANDLGGPHF